MEKFGFSLIELSVVLIILGLLASGIVAGKSLIRAGELRSITTELKQYEAAVHTFRNKYLALPGDMPNAEDYWGTMATGVCPNATGGSGTQTCNGNGDGRVVAPIAAAQTGEKYAFWKHLANAGLIQGQYSGMAGADDQHQSEIGVNVPASKLSGAGISTDDGILIAGGAGDFPQNAHRFWFGAEDATNQTYGLVLTPTETWSIDTKIDDGRPGLGKVMAWRWQSNCTTTDSALTPAADAAQAEYRLTNDFIACSFIAQYQKNY